MAAREDKQNLLSGGSGEAARSAAAVASAPPAAAAVPPAAEARSELMRQESMSHQRRRKASSRQPPRRSKSATGQLQRATMEPATQPRAGSQDRDAEEKYVQDLWLRAKPADANLGQELWLAAKSGNVAGVDRLLKAGAQVDYVMDENSEDNLTFKNRKLTNCQALHAAAYYRDGNGKERGAEKARGIVALLLAANANAKATACCSAGKSIRRPQAIHLAASSGNDKVVDLLLQNGASPDEEALIGTKTEDQKEQEPTFETHYMPIHDAVWFKREHTVKLLLERRANIAARNTDGNTALHLAAKLGYVEMVQVLLGMRKDGDRELAEDQRQAQKTLSDAKNNAGKVALEVAVEESFFPLQELFLFTRGLDGKQLLQAFVKVATACPEAACALLRSRGRKDESEETVTYIDERYRKCMQAQVLTKAQSKASRAFTDHGLGGSRETGGGDASFNVALLARLVRSAPRAAIDVLDALTDEPEVVDKEHHPLPIRAHLHPGNDFCPLYCAYEEEPWWDWDPSSTTHGGGRAWHAKLAPKNSQQNHEVNVKVVKMPGLAHPSLLSGLAQLQDQTMFTKLPVHALLKFVWKQLKSLLIMDLLCEALALVVISRWIVHPTDFWFHSSALTSFTSRIAWCFVAAQGLLECAVLISTGVRHVVEFRELGQLPGAAEKTVVGGGQDAASGLRGRLHAMRSGPAATPTWEWFWRSWHRVLLAVLMVTLALMSQEEHWPDESTSVNFVLGTASFLHWANVLYELRAFQWTGQRLLPIMKSIQPISGMVVILIFLLVGFLHAFWAMERNQADVIRTWQIVTFLFAGDNFIDDEELQDHGVRKQSALVLLGGFGVFTFMACAMNLFIAVLGDIYDQQQELMVCTFMKERSRICSSLYMRPQLKKGDLLHQIVVDWVLQWRVILPLSFITVLCFCAVLETSSWPAAMLLALWGMLQQLYLRSSVPLDWEKKYLWLCTSTANAEQLFSLGHEQHEKMKTQGRVWKLKRYIKATVGNEVGKLREDLEAFKKQLGEQKAAAREGQPGLQEFYQKQTDALLKLQEGQSELRAALHELTLKFNSMAMDSSKPP